MSGLAHTASAVLLGLYAVAALAAVGVLWGSGVGHGVLLAAAGASLLWAGLPLLALHMLADCRDALWYLAAAEERLAADEDDKEGEGQWLRTTSGGK